METDLTRVSLGRRLGIELDARAENGECTWYIENNAGRIRYVISPGEAWGVARPPTLYLTPGEAAEWCNIPLTE